MAISATIGIYWMAAINATLGANKRYIGISASDLFILTASYRRWNSSAARSLSAFASARSRLKKSSHLGIKCVFTPEVPLS